MQSLWHNFPCTLYNFSPSRVNCVLANLDSPTRSLQMRATLFHSPFFLSIAILSDGPPPPFQSVVVKCSSLISIWHVSRDVKRPRMESRPIVLRRTFWCVLQGLERDGQRTRAGILADVNDSRRDNVEPFQHRRIRLLDCFARYGESSFILRRLDPAKENRARRETY